MCFLGSIHWFIWSDNGIKMSTPGNEIRNLFSFFSPYSSVKYALSQHTFWNFRSKMHSFHHFIYLLSYTVLPGHTEPNVEIFGYIIIVFFGILWYVLRNMLRIDTNVSILHTSAILYYQFLANMKISDGLF